MGEYENFKASSSLFFCCSYTMSVVLWQSIVESFHMQCWVCKQEVFRVTKLASKIKWKRWYLDEVKGRRLSKEISDLNGKQIQKSGDI